MVVPDVLDRAGFIRLGSQAGNTVLNGTVNGDAGSQVRFYYQPDSPTGSATDNRFRRIRVTYEDGSLEHIVYNRQGYGDVQMTAGGPGGLPLMLCVIPIPAVPETLHLIPGVRS